MNKPFDLIAPIASFAKRSGISLNAPNFITQFIADTQSRAADVLNDKNLLYGIRIESLFEATIISLGQYRLFKTEDVGRVHSPVQLRAPDFRIVLEDGNQWLVEVKSAYSSDPLQQKIKLTAAYLKSIKSYADIVGVPLKLAIFWPRWKLWTLISPEKFSTQGGGLVVTMGEAMMANQMGELGDVHINTVAPLKLVLEADKNKPSQLHDNGVVEFTIRNASLLSGNVKLIALQDQRLAWILMSYGQWITADVHVKQNGGTIEGVEYIVGPREKSCEEFDFVGIASSIFSTYFASVTTIDEQITQLTADSAPGWFSPLSRWDFRRSKLPLWLFRMDAKQ